MSDSEYLSLSQAGEAVWKRVGGNSMARIAAALRTGKLKAEVRTPGSRSTHRHGPASWHAVGADWWRRHSMDDPGGETRVRREDVERLWPQRPENSNHGDEPSKAVAEEFWCAMTWALLNRECELRRFDRSDELKFRQHMQGWLNGVGYDLPTDWVNGQVHTLFAHFRRRTAKDT